MLDLVDLGLARCSMTPAMTTRDGIQRSLSHEHGAGWHVFICDEHVADLEWLRDEDPCCGYFEFSMNAFTSDSSKLEYALSRTGSRLPDDKVFLINRATGGILGQITAIYPYIVRTV